jgi:hypothetical protein
VVELVLDLRGQGNRIFTARKTVGDGVLLVDGDGAIRVKNRENGGGFQRIIEIPS